MKNVHFLYCQLDRWRQQMQIWHTFKARNKHILEVNNISVRIS